MGPSYEVLYPNVRVTLPDPTSEAGNVYGVIAQVMRAIRLDVTAAAAAEFKRQAEMQSSYEGVIDLVHRWVTVVN